MRNLQSEDYPTVIAVLNEWWGGRNMADMLPRLFFQHFQDTSFVVEQDGGIVGFLVGFLSQAHPDEAYIHFVGVHPDYRQQGIGEAMYERFFEAVHAKNRKRVRCVTSPVNKGSIAYHTKMGFDIEPSGTKIDGMFVHEGYDGHGQARVLFVKKL